MRKAVLLAFVLSFLAQLIGQAPAKPAISASAKPSSSPAASQGSRPGLLPSKEAVDSAMQRTFGYDPSITWQIIEIRESSMPDVADVMVSINKQNPQHIYWAQGKQQAVVGEMLPFGPDPYGPTRAKLQAADGPSKGAADPKILIVDFSDLQCPHCKAAQPNIEKLISDFPQVKLIFQQFPLPASLHPWALKAAQYADCVGRMDKDKTAFWKFIDMVFENQGGIALATADDQLKGFAAAVGLDGQKVANCSTTIETENRVKKSLQLGESLDVNQTPTVFINGRRVLGPGNIPYEQLKNLVQFEIDHAGR